jgi:methyl-accepting chemotaxis protein
VLGNIDIAAEQVTTGSKQVADSTQALSQGATEQASSIEELTASIAQMAVQTKHNALNASQANELAIKAKDEAVQGNERMKNMLTAMSEINAASSSISKVVKVIDEIAFQTNMLALNAAVEAARAGQHGRGFAVVAEEVRHLAARSANAVKETTALIEGSIQKSQAGTKIADQTAEALGKIVAEVEQAANLVSEIATASNDQATAIAQIDQGLVQVSGVVQTNSATAEEIAASSEELSSQAEMLKEMVDKFAIKRAESPSILDATVLEQGSLGNKQSAETPNIRKIALSDSEFGKY